jgi:maleylpyruvate isomerase
MEQDTKMKQIEVEERVLHNYFRSSSSYRVRIALNLKGLPYQYLPVHLNRDGGEQFHPGFKALNPQALVPVLSEGGIGINQSLAILEYLEEKYPEPALLPEKIEDRAHVRQLALAIACEMHPLNNLRVLKFITGGLGLSEDAKLSWIRHWNELGLSALEQELSRSGKRGRFCFGDTPTIADCCLVPQLFNAQRFGIDLASYPTLMEIDGECRRLPEFEGAHPSRQPDAE